MSKKYKPDLRGLTEEGKIAYPKFTREEIEVDLCEICGSIKTVKKYRIIRKSGKTEDIYLCDDCTKLPPSGVELICLEEPKTEEEPEKEFILEVSEEQGDSLLL